MISSSFGGIIRCCHSCGFVSLVIYPHRPNILPRAIGFRERATCPVSASRWSYSARHPLAGYASIASIGLGMPTASVRLNGQDDAEGLGRVRSRGKGLDLRASLLHSPHFGMGSPSALSEQYVRLLSRRYGNTVLLGPNKRLGKDASSAILMC